jgi:hypothetical protein
MSTAKFVGWGGLKTLIASHATNHQRAKGIVTQEVRGSGENAHHAAAQWAQV